MLASGTGGWATKWRVPQSPCSSPLSQMKIIDRLGRGAFIIASVVTRAARFFLVAALLRYFGAPIKSFIEQRLTLVTTSFAAMIVLGFVALRYL